MLKKTISNRVNLLFKQTIVNLNTEIMTSRFVALPVKEGDAFLLNRNGTVVLVDGGKGKIIKKLLREHGQLKDDVLDIVVCTHNDLDHLGGILKILNSDTFVIKELRVPSIWKEICIYIGDTEESKRNFCKIIVNVIRDHVIRGDIQSDNLKQFAEEILSDPYGMENRYDNYHENRKYDDEVFKNNEDLLVGYTYEMVFNSSVQAPAFMSKLVWSLIDRGLFSISREQNILCLSLLNAMTAAVKNIWCIVTIAARKRIRVNYYIHDNRVSISTAGKSFLVPVNARKISARDIMAKIVMKKFKGEESKSISVMVTLAKSVSNRESIAFYAVETKTEPGVLFCAECGVEPQGLSPLRTILATVPHHGASDNQSVYQDVERWAMRNVVWVRSDSKNTVRPCDEFLKLRSKKYCTRCNVNGFYEQIIEFVSNIDWVDTAAVPCVCISRKK